MWLSETEVLRRILMELEQVDKKLEHIKKQQEKLMSGVDDLNAAVASIATDLTAETAVVQQVIAALQQAGQGGGLTDAQAEALAQQLQGSATNITNITTQLQSALPPAPPQTPA